MRLAFFSARRCSCFFILTQNLLGFLAWFCESCVADQTFGFWRRSCRVFSVVEVRRGCSCAVGPLLPFLPGVHFPGCKSLYCSSSCWSSGYNCTGDVVCCVCGSTSCRGCACMVGLALFFLLLGIQGGPLKTHRR